MEEAEKSWNKIRGADKIEKLLKGGNYSARYSNLPTKSGSFPAKRSRSASEGRISFF
jgi:hypothetical protein